MIPVGLFDRRWLYPGDTGFFDLETAHRCWDFAHCAPSHIYIPPGKGYRHQCPSCGLVTTIIPTQATL